jgi:hypothetical protein
MANFVFALVSALAAGLWAYGYFNGQTAQRLDRLEDAVKEIRQDLREIAQREGRGK